MRFKKGFGVSVMVGTLATEICFPFSSKIAALENVPPLSIPNKYFMFSPGLGGVRIEDMTVITENGIKNLTSSPKEYLIRRKIRRRYPLD